MGFALANGAALLCCTLTIGLVIVALRTTEWMTECLSCDNLFSALKKLYPEMGKPVPFAFDNNASTPRGKKACFGIGLFDSATTVTCQKVDLPVNVSSMQVHSIVTASELISVLISVVMAICLLISAFSGRTADYESKSAALKRAKVASLLLGFAVFASFGSMTYYTISTTKMVHEPLHFTVQLEPWSQGANEHFVDMGMGSNSGLENGRKKHLMIDGMDPVYGYGTVLGWASLVPTIAALCMSMAARHSLLNIQHRPTTMKL